MADIQISEISPPFLYINPNFGGLDRIEIYRPTYQNKHGFIVVMFKKLHPELPLQICTPREFSNSETMMAFEEFWFEVNGSHNHFFSGGDVNKVMENWRTDNKVRNNVFYVGYLRKEQMEDFLSVITPQNGTEILASGIQTMQHALENMSEQWS